MAHDLLELAEECEKEAAFLVIVCGASPTKTLDARAAAALRAAHEEFEYFNSFRDELQTANTKLTLENRELRELVKRHENALEYLFNRPFSNIKIDWEQYFLMHRGETYFVKFDTCDGFDCFKSYTPLAAIESAMKEEKA